ncbi:hypothetical protein [Nocardia brasiliensis]|nr:hypothetical protein [Nocardia brasiliensis]
MADPEQVGSKAELLLVHRREEGAHGGKIEIDHCASDDNHLAGGPG